MKASAKLLTPFSVTGFSLLFALGSMMLPAQAQENPDPTGGSFVPTSTAATPANLNANGATPKLPNVSGGSEALLRARQALARGDLDVARSMLETARHLPLDTTLTSDTPEKVAAMIARHSELAEMRTNGDNHLYNHGAVMFLLEQADRLVDYRDFATVEMLVGQSRGFGVQFKPGDMNPDHVLTRMRQIKASASTAQPQNVSQSRLQADRLLSQAQLAFDKGQLDQAQSLVDQIRQLNVSDDAFDDKMILPWDLELKIREARQQRDSLAGASPESDGLVQRADYYPELDQTRNRPVGNETVENENPDGFRVADARGQRLYDSGISAMSHDDLEAALEYFRMAWQYRDQLAPQVRQDLQTKISQMQINAIGQQPQAAESIVAIDEQLRAEMFQDVIRQRAIAEKMVGQRNPRGALNHMRMTRDNIESSDLDTAGKQQLIAVVEREIAEMERFIAQNISEIETDETNVSNLQSLEMDRQRNDDVERKIQALVNDFNMLIDERRFAEADVLASQAFEIAPENEAVVLMMEQSRFMGNQARIDEAKDMNARDRERFWQEEIRTEGMITSPERPIRYDETRWEQIATRKSPGMGSYANEQERLIWSALKRQTVQVRYNDTPLREAIDVLAEKANVNMIFDTRALELEGVSVEQPITHSITQPISVESALNIVLGGTGLVFKVEDEVVKITNPAALQANPAEQTYYVGDLVMPVPDYSGNALNMQFISPNNPSTQYNNGNGGFGQNLQDGSTMPINMMQQMPGGQLGFGGGTAMWSGAGPQVPSPQYSTWGPKGVQGGITIADFAELVNLIQETIDPDSWEINGGTARIRPFPTTLSLIVTQTQENQDRIQDLLTRLRELNDVQIVVEVRFIRLRDDFFERIGIDFDFKINDSSGLTSQAEIPDNVEDIGGRITVGRAPVGEVFLATADLDIPVTQNSFGSSVPQFGNFAADTALNFGFAILSDIEVFFLLQAAKGDERTNVTEAPTVTMFNGQSASVFDGAQVPFVTSITPVVGDFAAAQQPVITILPEGTQLNVRAVVSGDRRFVKMTLVPFFSQITEVNEFRFEGQRRVRQASNTSLGDILDAIGGGNGNADGLGDEELEIVESGTTVQLPTFANTTITTTVSVPDGGTVLLGGIKSMSEGRTERGVPFLSNIPYVNRLFKNVGIGRETNSLMMMVTPRIIIQEEEEQFQVTTGN